MPTLTLRKLIRFGDDGLVITLPKSWTRYYGLKPGDQLRVVANGELTICPLAVQSKGKREYEKNC